MSRKAKLTYDPISKKIIVPDNKAKVISYPKGIVYLRVSTEEQKTSGHGMERQLGNCELWAKRENPAVELVKTFSDGGETGTNLNRDEFLQAIEFIEKENKKELKIHYFICDTSSRFSRSSNIGEAFNLVTRIQNTGAKLVTVGKGGIRDTKTEEGLLSLGVDFIIDAVESHRSRQRSLGGSINRMRAGYRPFPNHPVGYLAIKEKVGDKENIILILDEKKASIIREGLTKFANRVLLTKTQLYNFFVKKGLTSNSPKNKTGRLHPSMVDVILDYWKLHVYAGYLIYPDWGLNEWIEGKHPAIISPDILDKLLRRLEEDKPTTNLRKMKYDTDLHEYPLKRILLCPECGKTVTKWKSLSHTGDYHHYYGCNNQFGYNGGKCPLFKKGLPRDAVHYELKEKLKSLAPDELVVQMFKDRVKYHWDQKMKNKEFENSNKQKKIKDIEVQMEKISNGIDNLDASIARDLIKEKQEKWALLNEEKRNLQEELDNPSLANIQYQKLLDKALTVITSPIAIWNLNKPELIQLLIQVCFNGKIYYKKKKGLHTPELSVIYNSFNAIGNVNSCNLEISINLLHPLEQELAQKQFLIATLYNSIFVSDNQVKINAL